jgi:hypothetical protein
VNPSIEGRSECGLGTAGMVAQNRRTDKEHDDQRRDDRADRRPDNEVPANRRDDRDPSRNDRDDDHARKERRGS